MVCWNVCVIFGVFCPEDFPKLQISMFYMCWNSIFLPHPLIWSLFTLLCCAQWHALV